MFYDRQAEEQKQLYKRLLKYLGSLSGLFSDSQKPYLYYRAHENCFCYSFDAENLARTDEAADAVKDRIGIGLKTWVGGNTQKVAEFGLLRPQYEHLSGIELVRRIAEYRNARIQLAYDRYGLQDMVYHVVKRFDETMKIYECEYPYIDINSIRYLADRSGNNSNYFTDGQHTYNFLTSKNTLYMVFDDLVELDSIHVDILDRPFAGLEQLLAEHSGIRRASHLQRACIRLYSYNAKKGKFVADKSGLNQWNAAGRPRNANEVYIPFPAEDRRRYAGFFPPRDTSFTCKLPNGNEMSMKICQQDGKAIMSNPNLALGKWLLRDILHLPEHTLLTYQMLEILDIDCVIFTKESEGVYSIDFASIGAYESFIGEATEEDE